MKPKLLSMFLLSLVFLAGNFCYQSQEATPQGVQKPCESGIGPARASAQEVPPLAPPVGDHIALKLVVPALTPVGEPIEATLTYDEPKADKPRTRIDWSSDAKWRAKPGAGHGIYLWATPGKHTLNVSVIVVTADDIDVQTASEEFTVGDPPPPPAPKNLKTLAGVDGTTLSAILIAIGTDAADAEKYQTAESIWNVYHEMIRAAHVAGALKGADAEPEIEARLTTAIGVGAKPLDRIALAQKIAAMVAEIGAPTPEPPKPPIPPIPVAGLRVLIVDETLDRGRLPAAQIPIFSSTILRQYVASHGGQFRTMDDDDDPSLVSPEWQKLRASITTPSPSWAVYTTAGGVSEPLPANLDAAMSELQRIAP